ARGKRNPQSLAPAPAGGRPGAEGARADPRPQAVAVTAGRKPGRQVASSFLQGFEPAARTTVRRPLAFQFLSRLDLVIQLVTFSRRLSTSSVKQGCCTAELILLSWLAVLAGRWPWWSCRSRVF